MADVGLKEVGQIGQLKIHPKNPDIAYVAAVGNPFGWGPDRGVYRTKDGGKTWQKVLFINDQTGAVSIAINWSNPERSLRRRVARAAQAVDDHQRRPGGRRRRLQDHRRRRSLVAHQQRLPRRSDRQGVGRRRAVEPERRLRAGRSEGRQGRALPHAPTAARRGRWSNSSQALRARPFYFNKVFVNPKDENDVWVTELNFHHSTDGGKTFVNVNTPHGDNHIVWFNPDNPRIYHRDQRRRREHHAGRRHELVVAATISRPPRCTWSTPTSSSPISVYGPQQDTGKNLAVPNMPPTSWGLDDPSQLWFAAPGCESGQVRPIPSGKIVYGDCKGEFGRMNVDDRPGAELLDQPAAALRQECRRT